MKGVLFDAAGTLIELREPVGESYSRVARDYGVSLPAWRITDAFARILAGAPPMVFPDSPLDEVPTLERNWWRSVVRSTFLATDGTARFEDFDACFDALYAHFSGTAAWRRRPAALETLRALRGEGLATGVVSNFDQRLPALLQDLDFTPLLDVVMLPAGARVAKPDRGIFELALAALGISAAEAVFVGDDRERDLHGARAAGLLAIDVGELATLSDLPDRLGRSVGFGNVD